MSLKQEERQIMVDLELEKAESTFSEHEDRTHPFADRENQMLYC